MLEWSEFARRLGRELAGLERDTILIVRERDESRHYVQAMREPDRLYAEAVSNNFLDGPLLLTLADEEVMSEAGWRPPADPAPRNWWTELPDLASGAEHGRLAEVMVTALRDVQGVRRPADLVYESFHRHGTGLIELLDFGLEIADASRVTRSRPTPPLAPDGPVPAEAPLPAAPAVPALPDDLEPRLADAKQRGDHTTYFELLLTADLVLPAVADAALPTTTIGSGTYITVFTSPQALMRSRPGPSVPTTFARLRSSWPDPSWQLAVNPGLASEVHLDLAAVTRLEAQQRESGLRALAAGAPPSPNGHHAGDPTVTTTFAPFDTPSAASMNGHDTSSGPPPLPDLPLPPVQTAEPTPPPPSAEPTPPMPAAEPAPPVPPVEPTSPVPAAEFLPPVPPFQATEPTAPPLPEPAGPLPPVPPFQAGEPAAAPPPEPTGPSAPPPYGDVPPGAAETPVAPTPGPSEPSVPPFPPSLPYGDIPAAAPRPVEAPEQIVAPPVAAAGHSEFFGEPPAGRPSFERADAREAVPALPLAAPVSPDTVPEPDAVPAVRPPHGARLWHWDDGAETPVAVYDAIDGSWTSVRADAAPAPRAD
ncbi:TY-Chap domain-containing protein [Actinomadura hibisca]|uniref:TY-Chap domain-containing protein n=1 Tax=Actinomadura hibisca TaxID=68565 RepID=UPI000AD26386|nr:hypothetical protein [Actinomadura hibisca]